MLELALFLGMNVARSGRAIGLISLAGVPVVTITHTCIHTHMIMNLWGGGGGVLPSFF